MVREHSSKMCYNITIVKNSERVKIKTESVKKSI